ncbi:hypothetical protein D3C75_664130 [compost metagenome]
MLRACNIGFSSASGLLHSAVIGAETAGVFKSSFAVVTMADAARPDVAAVSQVLSTRHVPGGYHRATDASQV